MIEFDCPYCGNHFSVPEKFSGQDGVCRSCKRLVVTPAPGEPVVPIEDLPADERCERLERMLRYATSKVDRLRNDLKMYEAGHEPPAPPAPPADTVADEALKEELEQARADLEKAETAHEEAEAARARLAEEVDALSDALEAERAETGRLRDALAEAEAAMANLRSRGEELESSLRRLEETAPALDELHAQIGRGRRGAR